MCQAACVDLFWREHADAVMLAAMLNMGKPAGDGEMAGRV